LVDVARTEVPPFSTHLANIYVRNNTIRLSGAAMSGLVGEASRRVSFNRNTYYIPKLAGKFWAWYDAYPITWRAFRARGQEANGIRRGA
jgi:hypothetical protein